MSAVDGRDFDLNLLRVFLVVADAGSVTRAAASLYLTQPAVSAALKRLTEAVGAALFVRQPRGVSLTSRGARLLEDARPHVAGLLAAALSPPQFDARTSDRTWRLGLEATDGWLLRRLLRTFERAAPNMRLIVSTVQFRSVERALTSRQIDLAVSVADELPAAIERLPLFSSGFVCLYDPRHARVGSKLSSRDYFAHDHVIVSYNGDLRGIVEDVLRKARRVRCALPSFAGIGAVVSGTSLLATVPAVLAADIQKRERRLRTIALPFELGEGTEELLWLRSQDDAALRFLRETILTLAGSR
jgi:LysR family transcriptional regulator, mexEF-oprN operon transcriptional activator